MASRTPKAGITVMYFSLKFRDLPVLIEITVSDKSSKLTLKCERADWGKVVLDWLRAALATL